jgi:uncharacterized membrane-anchored protein YhcB (DUF1043 family)
MSSRARLFRWIAAAAAVLVAVVVGIVTYQIYRGQQIAEAQRLHAQKVAEEQRQRAAQTLTAAVENAKGLTVELSRLFESEVTAPPARVKDILDRARTLQQQMAEDQRRNAQQALLAATGTANGLIFELANLFENEITVPAARVKAKRGAAGGDANRSLTRLARIHGDGTNDSRRGGRCRRESCCGIDPVGGGRTHDVLVQDTEAARGRACGGSERCRTAPRGLA